MTASAIELGGRLPSGSERQATMQLRQILAGGAAENEQKLKIANNKGATAEVVLSPAMSSLLIELLRHVASGDAVTLVPVHQMLTTLQAGDLLNMSRPYLIGLLEKGEIPYDTVGRHRRIHAEDLFAYKRERNSVRGRALAALAKSDAGLIWSGVA